MKYLILLMTLTTIILTSSVQASGRVPFAHQIIPVQNYSRASDQIAISGMIGDGGVQALASHGFKTIIDLRTSTEGTEAEKALVDATSMNYINIPMTVAGISDEQLEAFTKAVESSETPILIHCGSGNRAGPAVHFRGLAAVGRSGSPVQACRLTVSLAAHGEAKPMHG